MLDVRGKGTCTREEKDPTKLLGIFLCPGFFSALALATVLAHGHGAHMDTPYCLKESIARAPGIEGSRDPTDWQRIAFSRCFAFAGW